MKVKKYLIAAATALLILLMVVGYVQAGGSAKTSGAANNPATTTTKEKTFNCLNPVGIQPPVTIVPLSPRLDTIVGKTIYIVQGEADPIIMPALVTALQQKYPTTFFNYYQPSSSFGPTAPDDTMKAASKADGTGGANGIIRGNAW